MRLSAMALLVALAVAACGSLDAQDGDRSLNRRGIPPGPGLFTGEAGEWTVLRRDLPGAPEHATADDHTNEGTTVP
jgi:hypothetical protein